MRGHVIGDDEELIAYVSGSLNISMVGEGLREQVRRRDRQQLSLCKYAHHVNEFH